MKVAPPAGWRCCSRLALTVWSCSEDTVLICWQKCRSVLLDPAGWLSHQGMAPTAPLPPLPAHTGLHSSFPLCLPSHVEGPTSVTTPTRWTSESSDWRGQREALGGVETEEMGACSQWEPCNTLLNYLQGGSNSELLDQTHVKHVLALQMSLTGASEISGITWQTAETLDTGACLWPSFMCPGIGWTQPASSIIIGWFVVAHVTGWRDRKIWSIFTW